MKFLKWFQPGLRVKRWVLVILAGLCCAVAGAGMFFLRLAEHLRRPEGWSEAGDAYGLPQFGYDVLAGYLLLGGLFGLSMGLYRLLKSFGQLLEKKRPHRSLVEVALERKLEEGPRVVALGGGTGMSVLLSGLKEYTANITAVVAMADDGGSSGKLRSRLDMVPPGDIRKCLIALADEEPLMRALLSYRFSEEELEGHSFGNLFLTVLSRIKGDFGEGVREASRILQVRGRVLPSTLERVYLVAEHEDGSVTTGQRKISESAARIRQLALKPAPGRLADDIRRELEAADLIVLGPGSLFTSLLPNLLITGMAETLSRSRGAKVYVCNVASQEGETRGFSVKDHLEAIRRHTEPYRVFEYVLVHGEAISAEQEKEMRRRGGAPVRRDWEQLNGMPVRVVARDVLDREDPLHHDGRKLAATLLEILAEASART